MKIDGGAAALGKGWGLHDRKSNTAWHRTCALLDFIRLAETVGEPLDRPGSMRDKPAMPACRLSDPPARPMLGPDQIDDLAQAVLTLTRELWLVIDRQAVTEKLLERHGVDAAEIDAFQPDAAFAEELDSRRSALVEAIVGAMRGGTRG